MNATLPAQSEAKRRFASVQWLRAFAALLVVAEHVKNDIATFYLGVPPQGSVLDVFPFPAGVDVFFVISGFVMAHSSAALYAEPGAWRRFLLRRLARIAPLYWLVTTILLAFFALVGRSAWQETTPMAMLASYAFLPYPNQHGDPLPVLIVGWTLNYEMAFYVLFAALLGLRERRALAAAVAALAGVAVAGRVLPPANFQMEFWTNSIILEFAGGILLYGLHRRGLRLPALVRLALVPAALALLAANTELSDINTTRWYAWGGPAVLLVLAAVSGAPATADTRRGRLAELAGNLSYGTYLVHLLALLVVRKAVETLLPRSDWAWFGLLPAGVIAVTLAASLALFFAVERPLLRWAKRRTGIRLAEGPGRPPGP